MSIVIGRNTKLLLAIVAMLLAVTLVKEASAQSSDIRLPENPVTASYFLNEGTPAYSAGPAPLFDTTLSEVPPGFDVNNGTYDGWCVEPESGPAPAGETGEVTLYSSYDPNLPPNLRSYGGTPIPWPKINWVLNNRGGATGLETQSAVWGLISGDAARFGCVSGTVCGNLVQNADPNFVPSKPGDVIAVIATDGGGINNFDDKWQENVIEVPLGKLGDFVWNDLNANGIQDPGEPGISGVPVNLLDPGPDGQCNTGDEVTIKSTTTDSNGGYQFIVQTERTYCVGFEGPPGFVFSPPNQGNGADDSKADPNTGQTINSAFVPNGRRESEPGCRSVCARSAEVFIG